MIVLFTRPSPRPKKPYRYNEFNVFRQSQYLILNDFKLKASAVFSSDAQGLRRAAVL